MNGETCKNGKKQKKNAKNAAHERCENDGRN